MRSYLIQSILIPEVFVLGEIRGVPFLRESLNLLCFEILTPASRVIPIAPFQLVFVLLGEVLGFNVRVRNELVAIATSKTCRHSTQIIVGLPHLRLLDLNVEPVAEVEFMSGILVLSH